MKSIFLVRHAKSSWDDPATRDEDRVLNARGIRDAADMASRLHARFQIDAIVSSTATRAKTTAQAFAHEFGLDANHLIMEPKLYLARAAKFASIIAGLKPEWSSVAIFAHNPGITDFANSLDTEVATDNIPTCGIFAVQSKADEWPDFLTANKTLLLYDYPKLGS